MSSDVRPLVAIRVISIVRTRGNLREKTKDRRVLRVLRRLSSSRGIMRFQARAHAGGRARARISCFTIGCTIGLFHPALRGSVLALV